MRVGVCFSPLVLKKDGTCSLRVLGPGLEDLAIDLANLSALVLPFRSTGTSRCNRTVYSASTQHWISHRSDPLSLTRFLLTCHGCVALVYSCHQADMLS